MSERLRLRDVDPEALATATCRELVLHATAQLQVATSGELARALRALARYALGAPLPEGRTLPELLQSIAPLYTSYAHAASPDVDARPETSLALIVAAANARGLLDAGKDVGCNELALLTGIHRDHLTTIAEEIPSAYREKSGRRSWRFRATKALKQWIKDKAT